MLRRVLVPIAHGTEEMEAVTIIDICRRAGLHVDIGKVFAAQSKHDDQNSPLDCVTQGGLIIKAEQKIVHFENDDFDAIVMPGGFVGANTFRDCKVLTSMLHRQKQNKRLIAAICATPQIVLHTHGLLQGVEKMTGYPGVPPESMQRDKEIVCYSNNVLTSQGPGTAIPFSLRIVEILLSAQKSKEVKDGLLF